MKKISKILLGVAIIFMIIFLSMNFIGKSTRDYIQEAKEKADLDVCNDIPLLRIHTGKSVGGFWGGSSSMFYNARKYCKREALAVFPRSSGIYRFNSEEDMQNYYKAVRNNNPSGCLLIKASEGISYCFEALIDNGIPETCKYSAEYNSESVDQYNIKYQFCVKELIKNLNDLTSCDFLSSNKEFSMFIDCKSRFVAFGMLNSNFCEEFSGQSIKGKYEKLEFKDWESYCYYSTAKSYHDLLIRDPKYRDQRLISHIKVYNSREKIVVYYPKPEIKYVCDELNGKFTTIQGNSLNYTDWCERYYKKFNEFEIEVDLYA
jgi:hypothetical protein